MDKNILLKSEYRRFHQPDNEPTLYQKKVSSSRGIKYFINCYHYTFQDHDTWEFKIQLSAILGTVDISLFNTNSNTSIKDIETSIRQVWVHYGSKYYEEFTSSELKE